MAPTVRHLPLSRVISLWCSASRDLVKGYESSTFWRGTESFPRAGCAIAILDTPIFPVSQNVTPYCWHIPTRLIRHRFSSHKKTAASPAEESIVEKSHRHWSWYAKSIAGKAASPRKSGKKRVQLKKGTRVGRILCSKFGR